MKIDYEQRNGMTVRELIQILKCCDQTLPVATEAMSNEQRICQQSG